jgi:predicted MFS family arabinose efflux permease
VGRGLVALDNWRGVFWFNVAAALFIVVLAVKTVPESSSPQTARLDIPGFVAGAVGLGALTFAVILGESDGYHNSLIIGLFLIGVVAMTGFVHIERASKSPLLDLAYFKSSRFSGAMIVAFILYFSIFSIFFFTALYLSAIIGYAPARIALEFLPMAVAMIIAAVIAGRRVARIGPRAPMAEGACGLARAYCCPPYCGCPAIPRSG